MKRREKNVEQFVDRHLRLFSSPPPQEIVDAKERTFHRLRSETAGAEESAAEFVARPGWRWRFVMVAAAAAVMLVVFTQARAIRNFVWGIDAHAVVEAADGGLYRVSGGPALRAGERIEVGEAVRTNGGVGTTLKLADGSSIEMRSKSDLWLERADDGVRIRLSKGGVIVNAGKQRMGHLYVQTKDVTASVVGTVFLVNAEEEGSRVAVIEGEVRVQQGATEKKLLPGHQVMTNPLMEWQPVSEEIAWSRNAEAHVALLQQSAASTATRNPTQERLTFEVASIRPNKSSLLYSRSRSQPDGGFIATNVTLRGLILDAYSVLRSQVSGGRGWIDSDRFDIVAKAPENSTEDQFQVMLRALLADRFKLVVHTEAREEPIYVLVLARRDGSLGPQLKRSSQDCSSAGQSAADLAPAGGTLSAGGQLVQCVTQTSYTSAGGTIRGGPTSIADLAASLVGAANRAVVDRTGLIGAFDLDLRWTTDTLFPAPPNDLGVGIQASNAPSLFTALQEQLGLRLESSRGSVEVLVIDSVEHPEPN